MLLTLSEEAAKEPQNAARQPLRHFLLVTSALWVLQGSSLGHSGSLSIIWLTGTASEMTNKAKGITKINSAT